MGDPGEVFDLVCPGTRLFGVVFKTEVDELPGVVAVARVPVAPPFGLTGKVKLSGLPVPWSWSPGASGSGGKSTSVMGETGTLIFKEGTAPSGVCVPGVVVADALVSAGDTCDVDVDVVDVDVVDVRDVDEVVDVGDVSPSGVLWLPPVFGLAIGLR